jgi:hypothetical protein
MTTSWTRFLAIAVFAGGMFTGVGSDPEGRLVIAVPQAMAQPLPAPHAAPLGLHRSCARKIRAAYRPAGCTRRCYPRNFYRQRMDYCVQSGGSI